MRKTAWHKAAQDLGINPDQANHYLETLPTHDQQLINQAKRKDNPNILPHLPGLKAHAGSTTATSHRRSLGNPGKQPRTGAPQLNGTYNLQHLIAIKDLATTQGGLDNLQHNLDALRTIQDPT